MATVKKESNWIMSLIREIVSFSAYLSVAHLRRNDVLTSLNSLMKGLVYPAILGTILFTLFSKTGVDSSGAPVENWGWRLALAIAIIAFYCCDFLYLCITRAYSFFHFVAHVVAMVLMFISFDAIMPVNGGAAVLGEATGKITCCFLTFSTLYLCYDVFLLSKFLGRQKQNWGIDLKSAEERKFHKLLLFLEILSVIALLVLRIAEPERPLFLVSIIGLLALVYFFIMPIKMQLDRQRHTGVTLAVLADKVNETAEILNSINGDLQNTQNNIDEDVKAVQQQLAQDPQQLSGNFFTERLLNRLGANVTGGNSNLTVLGEKLKALNEQLGNTKTSLDNVHTSLSNFQKLIASKMKSEVAKPATE